LHGERSVRPQLTPAKFFWRAVIFVSVALIPVLIWFFFDVILIVIGAILIAVLLRLVAEPFMRWGKLPEPLALIAAGILVVAVVAGAGYLFGTQIQAEFTDVIANSGVTSIMKRLQGSQTGQIVLQHIKGSNSSSVTDVLSSVFTVSVRFLEAVVVTVTAGFYLAAQPQLYRSGLAKLFPRRLREEANETLEDIGQALRLWLVADIIQMILIGALSTLAVWLIGLPSPLALGPWPASPSSSLMWAQSLQPCRRSWWQPRKMHAVLWTAIAYIVIHQIEGNLIAPLIQRRLVFIPPAVMLLAIVTVLFVFGGFSVIFAGPMAVIVFVAVNKLYVRDSLGERTVLPGEDKAKS
jgi:predicted PurR-regulated permease PerM